MPLRKSGSILGTTLAAVALSAAVVPSTASAGLFSSLFATPKPTATPKPVATATPKPTATPHRRPRRPVARRRRSRRPCPRVRLHAAADHQGVPEDRRRQLRLQRRAGRRLRERWLRLDVLGRREGRLGEREPRRVQRKKSLMMPLNSTAPRRRSASTRPTRNSVRLQVDNASLSGFQAFVIYKDAAGKVTGMELVSSKGISLAPTRVAGLAEQPAATLLPLNSTSKTASGAAQVSTRWRPPTSCST